ncbi:ArsR/SmtB family transcription factor [Glutamicibacter sp.]|uniref:ArsR/SmtB family transcription factor n=1 Tax=Glutamicibacter sp. TaxID=1931995 RepID=UPI0037BF7003
MAIDEVFSALAEPTRRRIVEALRLEPKAVGTLVTELEISQPTVSKHLKVLREAKLVSMTAAGQRRIYSVDSGAVNDLMLWCAQIVPATQSSQPEQELELVNADESGQSAPAAQQLSRSVGRGLEQVTERAQEFFDRLPRFGRRK